MAERRRSAHAGDDQNNGVTLSAKKTRDPQSSYLYRSVIESDKSWSSTVYLHVYAMTHSMSLLPVVLIQLDLMQSKTSDAIFQE